MTDEELIELAKVTAKTAHEGQTRKGNAGPYFQHPYRVAAIVAEEGAPAFATAAAYLHDVKEDTKHSIDDFPPEVVELVDLLSVPHKSDKCEAVRKIKDNQWALLIKMADRLDNLAGDAPSDFRVRFRTNRAVHESTEWLLGYALCKGWGDTKLWKALNEELAKAKKE